MKPNRRSFLKALGLLPALPAVAKMAPLISAPAAALPAAMARDQIADLGSQTILVPGIRSNGDLYISGRFSSVSGAAPTTIARWNGAAWEELGSSLLPLRPMWFEAVGENPRWTESYQMDDTYLDSPDDE